MNESKVENQGLKFDLMRAQEPSEASEEEQQDQGDAKEAEDPSGSALKTPADAEGQLKGPEIAGGPEPANEEEKPDKASVTPDESR